MYHRVSGDSQTITKSVKPVVTVFSKHKLFRCDSVSLYSSVIAEHAMSHGAIVLKLFCRTQWG